MFPFFVQYAVFPKKKQREMSSFVVMFLWRFAAEYYLLMMEPTCSIQGLQCIKNIGDVWVGEMSRQ